MNVYSAYTIPMEINYFKKNILQLKGMTQNI